MSLKRRDDVWAGLIAKLDEDELLLLQEALDERDRWAARVKLLEAQLDGVRKVVR